MKAIGHILLGRAHRARSLSASNLARKTSFLLLLLGVALLAGAWRASPAKHATAGAAGTNLNIALNSDISPLDPQKWGVLAQEQIDRNIYEPLYTFSQTGEITNVLASGPAKQVKPTVWRIPLRKGISFSNGEPFNSRSAAYSVNRIVAKAYSSGYIEGLGTVKSARADGAYAIDVTTTHPDVFLPSRTDLIAMIPYKHAHDADFAAHPVGTGPYEWVSGAGPVGPIVLQKRTDYWGVKFGLPAGSIQTLTFRAIPDNSVRQEALSSGQVDIMTALSPDAATGGSVPGYASAIGLRSSTLLLNTHEGITADPKVRLALSLAIDERAVAEKLFDGFAQPSRCQSVSPRAQGYDPDLKPLPYNPQRAASLLAQANAKGQTITLATWANFPKSQELAQTVASYWEAAGLKVNVSVEDIDTYKKALFGKDFTSRPGAVYVATSTDLFTADTAARQITESGEQSAYSNPRVNALFTRAEATVNNAKRNVLFHQALSLACQDNALVNMVVTKDIYGKAADVKWTPRPDGRILGATITLTK